MLKPDFVIWLLFAIPVFIGIVLFFNSAWHRKLVKAYANYDNNRPRPRPCIHSIVFRKQLHGESYFQAYKHARCTGNNIIINGLNDNRGTLCMNCAKLLCGDHNCICKGH